MQNIHVPVVGTVSGLTLAQDINLGFDSLQQNIGGVLSKSVAGGVDVTLSTAEANNGIISLTGNISANINVIVPTSAMQWVFQNATTGAFSITIKTASGTGVVLPQGASDKLYCDGTNVLFSKSGTDGAISALGGLASINSGPISGFRNKLIGGHFDTNPWQRGTSFTFTATGTYVADKWRVDFDGTANITVDKVALGTAQKINGVWCRYGLRFTVNSKSGNSYMRLSQRIEDVDTLTTLPATLQTAIQGSGTFSVPVNARQSFGSGGSPSADVVTPFASNLAVTSSLQFLVTGVNVPSISGKTYGTTGDFLAVEYDLMAVPASGYVVMPLAGLESGNVATFWEDRRRAELAFCQRYYLAVTQYVSDIANVWSFFPVQMRGTPVYTGGGVGFSVALLNKSGIACIQTTGGPQAMTYSSDL